MAIGNWDPNAEQTEQLFDIERGNLDAYIELSRTYKLNELPTLLSSNQQQTQAACMRLSKDQWFSTAESLSDDEIEHLMRFFTIAEQLPGMGCWRSFSCYLVRETVETTWYWR